MDSLSCDLLNLIDKHLDAITSLLLGMSTGYQKYLTGYEDFHRDKNVKWLLYAICRRKIEESFVLGTSSKLLVATIKYIRKSQKYEWLDFIDNYTSTCYYGWAATVKRKIAKARLYKNIAVFKIDKIDNLDRSTIVYCIRRMFKVHWLEGIIKMSSILEACHGYSQQTYHSELVRWSYEFGFMDVLNYYNITPNIIDIMIGMLKSKLDYNQEIENLKDEFVREMCSEDANDYAYYNICILELICGGYKSQWLIYNVWDGNISWLIHSIDSESYGHQTIISCFEKAVKKSNIDIANIIMDIYIGLYKEATEYHYGDPRYTDDRDRLPNTMSDYSKIIDDMVVISVVHNVPLLYKKKIGSCECCTPFQIYCQKHWGNDVKKLEQKMVEAGDYSAYSWLPRTFREIQLDLKARNHQ